MSHRNIFKYPENKEKCANQLHEVDGEELLFLEGPLMLINKRAQNKDVITIDGTLCLKYYEALRLLNPIPGNPGSINVQLNKNVNILKNGAPDKSQKLKPHAEHTELLLYDYVFSESQLRKIRYFIGYTQDKIQKKESDKSRIPADISNLKYRARIPNIPDEDREQLLLRKESKKEVDRLRSMADANDEDKIIEQELLASKRKSKK